MYKFIYMYKCIIYYKYNFILYIRKSISLNNVLTSCIPSKTKLPPASHNCSMSRMASCHVYLYQSCLSDGNWPFMTLCFCHNGPSTPIPASCPLTCNQSDPTGLEIRSLYGAATDPPVAVHLDWMDVHRGGPQGTLPHRLAPPAL